MKIFSIELENFRQYKGKQKIDFSTDEQNNFTIIQGSCGSGKTSLLNAISWCLYEKEFFISTPSSSPNDTLRLVNCFALEQLENGKTFNLAVKIWLGEERPEYTIERSLSVKKRSDGKVYSPLHNSHMTIYLLEEDMRKKRLIPNTFVNSLLPEEVSRFFLLSGERVNDFLETENRESIRKASMMKANKEESMEATRRMIEARAKKYFLNFMWEGDVYTDVIINEDYSVSVLNKTGEDVSEWLTGGDRSLLAFSFMLALQKTSGFEFPIFLDQPLHRISRTNRENITGLLPNFLSKTQVIILVTDEWFTESMRSKMKERIGKEWQLVYGTRVGTCVLNGGHQSYPSSTPSISSTSQ